MRVEINSPCPVSWNAEDRCGKSRFCHLCTKTVHNLSNMTEPEAEQVIARRDAGEEICVSFVGDRKGNVLFDKVKAFALAAAGLMTAQVAMADGQIPTLQDLTDAADAAAHAVVTDPLADVSDTNCNGDKPVGDAPAIPNTDIPTGEVEAVIEPDPDWYAYDGGI